MKPTVLILGPTGRFGRAAEHAFCTAGWTTVRFDRGTDDLVQAARAADVIVNAWNPQYPDWADQVPRLHDQVIAAAKAAGATVIVPGNVYVYGPQATPPWGQETPQEARNPLGQIRIAMEQAYRQSGVRTIVLRAGDFIDTVASGNWFDAVLTKRLASGRFSYPGPLDVPHAWAFLPDLARAAVQLAERREELPVFSDISFPGYTVTGAEMATALDRIVTRPVRMTQMSWIPLRLLKPVWPMARCLLEMRYLWQVGHTLDGTLLEQYLPGFAVTPFETALAQAIPPGLVAPPSHPLAKTAVA
ncbi:sugar nucleotide-binding protein [Rhodobacteraceae bacterium M382]|nr:sugar nucleotide-binding protein [Rhodobacteraceae bacterium M382]